MVSIEDKILAEIRNAERGKLFFVEDLLTYGSAKGVAKALERLVKKGEVTRVARGIYSILEVDEVIGPLSPTTDAIAKAISERDQARIIPTGSAALNALGLSTQIPMNVVYLTDGSARKITLGNRTIKFKKTAPKNLAAVGQISSLTIQALKEIGKENITEKEISIILKQLAKEKPDHLTHDIKLAPEWIRIIMRQALKHNYHE